MNMKEKLIKADRPLTCDTLNTPWLLTNRQFQWSFAITIGWTGQAES